MSTRTRISHNAAYEAKSVRKKKSLKESDTKKTEKEKKIKVATKIITELVEEKKKEQAPISIPKNEMQIDQTPETKKLLYQGYLRYLEGCKVSYEKYCFRCKFPDNDTLKCDHDDCIKQFHEKCISFEDDFICKRHVCNECDSTVITQQCKLCETSFCKTHMNNKEKREFICGECKNILN
jgi:hypothetical protein